MSIEKDYDIYIAVCDICGDDIGPFEDFYDAVDAKKKPPVGVHAKTRMGNGLTFAPLVSTRLPHLILEVSYEKSRDIGCCKGLCLR